MRSLVATCKSSDNIYHIMTLNIQIITTFYIYNTYCIITRYVILLFVDLLYIRAIVSNVFSL